MNEIGVVMLGAAIRGTAFAGLGVLFCLLFRKRGPATSALISLATLVGMVGVFLLGISPGARWWSFNIDRPSPIVRAETPQKSLAIPDRVSDESNTKVSPVPAIELEAAPVMTGFGTVIKDLGQVLLRQPQAAERSGWSWQAWVSVGVMAGVCLGLVRFALGLIAVSLLRQSSRPLDDSSMMAMAEEIRAELAVDRSVEVRVSPGLATPATLGARRPVILLPEDWSEWDARERRVVLSHEMAHIFREDYVSGLWAQFCLALHYYHPLAHWLAGRLRLNQELAADAWGARLSGGNRTYLTTLARMALRNDPKPVGWPARSFRPGRGTLVRRIEMLRDMNEIREVAPLPRRTRWMALSTLLVAGLAIAGLRGPGSITVAAATPLQPPAESSGVTLEHGHIPADTAIIAVIRPAELLANPELGRFFQGLEPIKDIENRTNLKGADLEQVTIFWTFAAAQAQPRRGPALGEPSGVIFRTTKPQDWKAILTKAIPEFKEAKFGDFTYFLNEKEGQQRVSLSSPDDRTLIVAETSMLLRLLTTKPGALAQTSWADAWKSVKKGQVALAVDTTFLAGQFNPKNNGQPVAPVMSFGLFAPLLERANAYAISINATKTISLDGYATCNSDDNARQVSDTLKAILTLGRNALETFRGQAPQVQGPGRLLTDYGLPVLEKASITTEGKSVHVSATSDLQMAQVVQLLVPSVQAQRSAAVNAQSVNNLKQIGLAFHNYADSKGKFPAASILGPDGKTLHSWRVAILPYLEQQALYNEYKFDEPWDSPSNRKLLDHIPLQYRYPHSKASTSASYFVLTGKDTLFPGTEGTSLDKITDGTSNTILAVEADRDIPWTKPEDIPFDPNGPLPKLGGFQMGGFNALMSDGSVKRLKDSINPIVLKALFTRSGGEIISSDAY